MSIDPKMLANLTPEQQRELLAKLLQEKNKASLKRFPLSFEQQRLWFLEKFMPDSPVYNYPLALRLKGELNTQVLQASINEIISRHEALRTSILTEEGKAYQVIHPPLRLQQPEASVEHLPEAEREEEAMRLAQESIQVPFKLDQAPLCRSLLIRLSAAEHILVFTIHHIMSDGWSMGLLTDELGKLYDAFLKGKPSPLAPLEIQYAEYAQWQRDYLEGEVLDQQLDYWKQKLAGPLAVLNLPRDRPHAKERTLQGVLKRFTFDQSITSKLKEIGRQEGTTLYMTVLTAFKALLYRYCGQDDIVIGTPMSNRTREELEGLIGFFVNTMVLRTDAGGNPSFRELLRRVKQVSVEAYAHQDVPFDKLVEALQPERGDMSQSPLFQVMFQLASAPKEQQRLAGLAMEGILVSREAAKFDLTMTMLDDDENDELIGMLEYSLDLFEESTIERMLTHFEVLVRGFLETPDLPLSAVPMLSQAELDEQLTVWNQTQADYPKDRCAHHLFEAQAARTPDASAVHFDGKELTYRELNERANQVAHHLQAQGIRPDSLVGLCVERTPEMVIGMLGILKAGAAYVPIDPAYPQDRILHMLHDSQAPVLLTQSALLDKLPSHTARTICLDTDWADISAQPSHNPDSGAAPHNLAYIIYTSGSTGKPKGVMIEHQGLVNYLWWAIDAYGLEKGGQGAPVHSSASFDLTVTGLYPALLTGKTVVLVPQALQVEALSDTLRAHQDFSLIKITPAHLKLLAQQLPPETLATGTRALVIGGEALSREHIQAWQEHAPNTALFNEYGPTETVVGCVVYEVPSGWTADEANVAVPIGRPIANTLLYVLDSNLQPVPLGSAGELYIGGDGVARGYLNRPDLTEERFLPDPFAGKKGARMYKTGDLVRYRKDGVLEYLDRIDNQVKIRGYRIELQEIEAVLAEQPSVVSTVVVAQPDSSGEKRLVAYIVTASGDALPDDQLRSQLEAKLPDYMIPSAFVFLHELPINQNGKVDKTKLPVPEQQSTGYVAPRDALEVSLIRIFESVLGVKNIGIRDDFFALGGHSISAVYLVHRIQKDLQADVPVSVLFRVRNVAKLANYLRGSLDFQSASCLLPIQAGDGSKPPLFLVHPGGGSALCYFNLARGLGEGETVYGLQSYGLESDEEPFVTLEAMAARYIEELRAVHPQGPYRLGGWSLGGNVAYEMVKQLEAAGERVEFLALFDTIPADVITSLKPPVIRALGGYAELFGQDESVLEGLTISEAVDLIQTLAQAQEQLPETETLDSIRRKTKVAASNATARSAYRFEGTISAKILLFTAEEVADVNPLPLVTAADWNGKTTGPVRVIPVPGNHHILLEDPNVFAVADIFKGVLQQLEWVNQ